MASSLTNLGEQVALRGNAAAGATTDGGINRLATKIKLYQSSYTPTKDVAVAFTEVANGNGYTTNGKTITPDTDWTFSVVSTNGQIKLADQTWTASGGQIASIKGGYLCIGVANDATSVLAWWERSSAVTLDSGDTFTLDDLTIRLT